MQNRRTTPATAFVDLGYRVGAYRLAQPLAYQQGNQPVFVDQQCQARDVGHRMDLPVALGARPVLPDSGLVLPGASAMLTCVVFTFPGIIGITLDGLFRLDGRFVLGPLAYAQEG